jgi:hypothetical protein
VTDKQETIGLPVAQLHLSSSNLWGKALEKVKADSDWPKYSGVVKESLALVDIDVNSPDGIVAVARKVSEQVQSSKLTLRLAGRSIVVRDILDKAVDILAVLKDVGAAATNLNPYAAVAWGGLQFFVQAAVIHKEVTALCWDELPRMVRLISQYQTFELLYDTSCLKYTGKHLGNALVDLFSAILRFQIVIVKYASSRTERFKTAFQDKASSLPQQVIDEVRQCEDEVAKLQTAADREISGMSFQRIYANTVANNQQLKEVSKLFWRSLNQIRSIQDRTAAHLETISTYVEEMQRNHILEWISTIKYGNAHTSDEKSAMAGTGLWLTVHPAYVDWRSSERPSVFWLHGFMGTGKSCLAHAVIEDIKSCIISSTDTRKLAYFYCDGASVQGASEIAKSENILRCLLQQLSRIGCEGRRMAAVIATYRTTHLEGNLSKKQCMSLLRNLVNESERTIFVIDGLDECSEVVQLNLVKELTWLLSNCTSPLSIFVSSRQTRFIDDLFTGFDLTEIDTAENNSTDVATFVITTAREAASSPGLRTRYHDGNNDNEDAVVQKIMNKAGGMFRWAQLAFDYLHLSPTFSSLRWRLEQLDHLEVLFSFYDKIYDDMVDRLDAPYQDAVKTLLVFILYGRPAPPLAVEYPIGDHPRECLHIAHVLEACAFVAQEKGTMPEMNAQDLRSLSPSLVTMSYNIYYKFGFPHFSVKEWLTSSPKFAGQYSSEYAPSYLARLSMRVIMSSCDITEPSAGLENEFTSPYDRLRLNSLQRYSFQGWVDHLQLTEINEASGDVVNKLFDQKSEKWKTLEAFLFKTRGNLKFNPSDKPMTGFQYWHMVLAMTNSWNHIGRTSRFKRLNPSGLDQPKSLAQYYHLPRNMILPSFVCGLLGHHCELSRFDEVVLDVESDVQGTKSQGFWGSSETDWQTRSLASVMATGSLRAVEWLLKQLKPSSRIPRTIADALLLKFSIDADRDWWNRESKEPRHMTQFIFQFSRLLIQHGIDVDVVSGISKTPAMSGLIDCWIYRIFSDKCADIAFMIKCLLPNGEAIKVSLEVDPVDFAIPSSHVLDAEDLVPLFYVRRWDESVWTSLLALAVRSGRCSATIIRELLSHGADPLGRRWSSRGEESSLQAALKLDKHASVLELLSAAAFPTHRSGSKMASVDPDGTLFLEKVISRCSESTIKLWMARGANPYRVNRFGRNALTYAKLAGRPEIEAYLKSLQVHELPSESDSSEVDLIWASAAAPEKID